MGDREVVIRLTVDGRGVVTGVRQADGALVRLEGQAGRTGNVFQTALGVTAANAVAALTRRLMQLGAVTLRTGADFEAAMARVGAISRATASQQEALERAAREAGATTVFSATEAAEA